jgi:hypothetical protein
MMRAERVLEAGVSRAGINQICPAKLPDVTQTLKNLGVDELERQLVDADVIPDGVAQDLEADRPSASQMRIRLWDRRF